MARIDRTELSLSLLATVGVVLFGAMDAILLVVVLSLLRFIRLTARPAVSLRDATAPGVACFRFDGPIVFFSAPHFKREVLAAAARAGDGLRRLVLDMEPVNHVDATGLLAIRDVRDALAARGVTLLLAGRRDEWAARVAGGDARELLAGVTLLDDPTGPEPPASATSGAGSGA